MGEPWEIVYYKTADGRVPAFDYFIDSCTTKLHGFLNAVLDSVAAAPPPAFSGGGHWAMRGDMAAGEMKRRGLENTPIAVITGLWKPNATLFSDKDYADVRALGDDHLAQLPRRIATPEDVDAFIERLAEKRAREQAKKREKGKR